MAVAAWAGVVAVSDQEALNWIRYTVPLPKSIKITGKVQVQGYQVQVKFQGDRDIVTDETLRELKTTLSIPDVPSANPAFTISLQIGGPEAEALKLMPPVEGEAPQPRKNADQAYRIYGPDTNGKELRVVALTSRGLYYAAKTLQQLVVAKKVKTTVTIPILDVTDWPDMSRRGLWGTDNFAHLRWLADRKMNLCEQISASGVDEQGKPFARLKEGRDPLVTEGPKYAIEFSPVILHLEQSSQNGTIRAHPELKGKGAEHPGVLCYSQPGVSDILAEWMVQLASLPHVTSIDTWMTENLQGRNGCQCDLCKGKEWPVLEARAIVTAWRKAQQKLGHPFTLRVMTAEATEDSNEHILAELPPDVQFAYYHSLLTYITLRRPQLRNYIGRAASEGRWVGVVPNVSPTVGFCEPFTGAAFIDYRMTEYVDKDLSGLIGYATPRVGLYKFNVEAAAEWTWNNKGRTTREFALSYAMRQGYKDPQKFADWSEIVGPVGWDVYGSGFPNEELRNATGPVAKRLKEGRLPKLGYVLWDAYPSPWGNITSEQQLDADVESAAKGVQMAKEMGMQPYLQESLVVDGYIRALKALYELKQLVKPAGVPAAQRDEAHRWYLQYVDGLKQAKAALPKWEDSVATEEIRFTDKPVETIDTMLQQMKDVAAEKGF